MMEFSRPAIALKIGKDVVFLERPIILQGLRAFFIFSLRSLIIWKIFGSNPRRVKEEGNSRFPSRLDRKDRMRTQE